MTYEEFLREWFDEKNGGGEYYDTYSTEEDSPWKVGWTRTEIVHDEEEYTWIEPITDDEGYYWLTKEADGVKVSVGIEYGEYGYITKISIEADGVDVANEEIGTIDAVDALLGTGLDAASKKAEELKKRKLVTVANLQKALEDYDERKGTAVEDGEPTDGKNKVFIDGSGRVYARRTELARQSGLNGEKSDRQSADNRLSAEIAKKADKEHTHKAADITDLPNYARSVNGEEPDADGNVEIDIDAVVEVAELPAETKKKVYLVPEVTTEKTVVDCSSAESILSAAADYVSGIKGHSINSLSKFFDFVKHSEGAKKGVKNFISHEGEAFVIDIPEGITVNGKPSRPYIFCERWKGKPGEDICKENRDSVVATVPDSDYIWMFQASVGGVFMSELFGVSGFQDSVGTVGTSPLTYVYNPMSLPTSMYFGEDSRTPPAVYAKSVELATKEALSEATSGADEKAAALGERIGAVESSVTTAKSDIAAMKSDITEAQANITEAQANITEAQANITEAQANITTAQSDITKAQGDIEAVTSEVETVKNDVAALEGKVVRSVNGTEPDENGNVEVAASSDASGKNDTITVSDTDSAISDDTGILSGESGENPKGLLRFAASKIWDYVRGKIASVLKISYENGYAKINEDAIFSGIIETPYFQIDGDGWISSSVVRRGTKTFTSSGSGDNEVRVDFDEISDDDYSLIFEIMRGAECVDHPIQVNNKDAKGFDVTVYTQTEDETITFEYTAIALHKK